MGDGAEKLDRGTGRLGERVGISIDTSKNLQLVVRLVGFDLHFNGLTLTLTLDNTTLAAERSSSASLAFLKRGESLGAADNNLQRWLTRSVIELNEHELTRAALTEGTHPAACDDNFT